MTGGEDRFIGPQELARLAVGARVLAAGTEESAYQVALDWAAAELDAHGPVRLLSADRVAPASLCVAVTLVGASAALAEALPTGEEPLRAVRAVERITGRPADAVVPLNTAAENAMIALATAARCGLPLVDGDGCGRVLPLLEQTLFTLAGVAPAPLALATPGGDVITVESARSGVEEVVRPLVLAAGGWAVVAGYPMDAATMARSLVPGTVGRAIEAGALAGPARVAAWRPRRLCRGRVVALEASPGPYGPQGAAAPFPLPSRPASVLVDEEDGLRRRFRLEAYNEVLLVLADGAVVASMPDHILLVTSGDGRVLDVERAVPGLPVDVVVIEAAPAWHTPQGRALAGAIGDL